MLVQPPRGCAEPATPLRDPAARAEAGKYSTGGPAGDPMGEVIILSDPPQTPREMRDASHASDRKTPAGRPVRDAAGGPSTSGTG
jgi:hypothetical protein